MDYLTFKQHLANLLPNDKLLHGLEGVIYTVILSFVLPLIYMPFIVVLILGIRELFDEPKDPKDVLAALIGSLVTISLILL